MSNAEFSESISVLGIKKANTRPWQLFLLAILAGLYIALGGHISLVAQVEGMGKVAGGAVFSVGLVLLINSNRIRQLMQLAVSRQRSRRIEE